MPAAQPSDKDGRWIAIACTNDKSSKTGELDRHLKWRARASTFPNETQIALPSMPRSPIDDIAQSRRHSVSRPRSRAGRFGTDEIFEDAYQSRGNIRFIEDPRSSVEVALQDTVPRLSATPGGIESLGPGLGDHNREIYLELLGMTEAELTGYQDAQII